MTRSARCARRRGSGGKGGRRGSTPGAPGSPGGGSGATDATNEPGQTEDGLTGITESEISRTGAPGTQGASNGEGGGTSLSYTKANDGIGPYEQVPVSDDLSGPGDWTGANDSGYATGGPQLPGIRGNEPQAGSDRFQPGGGQVMRGGRNVRP